MAKVRKVNSASKKKTSVSSKKTVPAAVVVPAIQPADEAKKKKMLVVLAVVFIAFLAAEVFVLVNKSVKQNKKPVYVTSWAHNYKGCTSIGEYGNYIYAIDNTRGDVYQSDKQDGRMIKVLNFTEGVNSALEDSTGKMMVLTKSGEVLELESETYRVSRRVKLPEIKAGVWMDIDSKNNLYVLCGVAGKVYRYNDKYELTGTAGGGDSGLDFSRAGKVFTDFSDDVYVMGRDKAGQLEITILDNNLKKIKSWPAKGIKKIDSLTNMAIAKDKNVYINAYEESRIYVFNNNGKLQGSFDRAKDSKFQIIYAAGITGGRNGKIYVHTHKLGVFETIKY